jgi:photosystem II stability/assembly factor-like uncharacterized protein
MTFTIKKLSVLLPLLCLLGCKKNDPGKSSVDVPAKSIEVISGNNQFGYAGKTLADTIVIKVIPGSTADSSKFSYYFRYTNLQDEFSVVSVTHSNGVIYIKALWQPSSNATSASLTFYTYTNCTNTQINAGNCKTIDSVKLSATIRKPWVSVYYGNQGGYDVLYDLHFTNTSNGIAIGEGSGVVRTSDGGKTWAMGPPVRSDNDASLISFAGPDTGLVEITNNYAYFTYDGGQTFTQQPWSPPFVGDRSSSAYYMASRNIIYSVGWHGSIAKTTDGGVTWVNNSFSFLNELYAITAIGTDTLYACGDVGKIVKTTDAGKTWKEQPIQLNDFLSCMYFITNNYGFAAGQYGALVRTTDGGATWNIIKTGLSFNIIAIRFFTNLHGFIVSNGGEIAETTDGGLTWAMRNTDNYGANDLNKAVIKDETTIFGVQESSIYTYDLTQK